MRPTLHLSCTGRTSTDDDKVHADASTFPSGVTKEEAYEQVLMQAEGLFYEQRNWVGFFSFLGPPEPVLSLGLVVVADMDWWRVRCGMSCLCLEKGEC